MGPRRTGRRILVTEDNSSIRRILCHILQQAGYETLEAEDGEQALDLIERDRPDLVVLDVIMPGMDGFEACQHIKSNPKLKDLPVVMCTSMGRKDDVLRALGAGADDYIVKPFNRTFILNRIKRAMSATDGRMLPEDGKPERRSLQRVNVTGSVTWTTRGPSGAYMMFKNQILNISSRGVGVTFDGGQETAAPAPRPNDRVELIVELTREETMEADGRIVHVTPLHTSDRSALVGMAFTKLPEDASIFLARFAD